MVALEVLVVRARMAVPLLGRQEMATLQTLRHLKEITVAADSAAQVGETAVAAAVLLLLEERHRLPFAVMVVTERHRLFLARL